MKALSLSFADFAIWVECDTFPHPLGIEVRALSAAPVRRLKLESYFMTFPTIGGIELWLSYQPLPRQRSHLTVFALPARL